MPFVCHAASSCCYTADTGMQIRLRYRRSAPGTPAVANSGPSLREARVGDGGGDGPTQPPSSQHKRETCPSQRGAVAAPTAAPPRPPTTAPPTVLPVAAPTAAPPPAPMVPPVTARWPGVSPQAVVIAKANPIAMVARVAVRDMWSLDPGTGSAPLVSANHRMLRRLRMRGDGM
jgi:hypothetical protein